MFGWMCIEKRERERKRDVVRGEEAGVEGKAGRENLKSLEANLIYQCYSLTHEMFMCYDRFDSDVSTYW